VTTGTPTSSDRRQLADDLLAEIAAVAEAAYRRGFQQGNEAAARGGALAFDLNRWRFSMPRTQSPEQFGGRIIAAAERLEMEAPGIAERLRAAIAPTHGIE
jgi:hypothetical protein